MKKSIYYICFAFVLLCGSCGKKDNKKDNIQEVSARISPILDTISLDYAQYENYLFINYSGENVLFRIYHYSPDTSLHYDLPVYCNANIIFCQCPGRNLWRNSVSDRAAERVSGGADPRSGNLYGIHSDLSDQRMVGIGY